MRERKQAEGVTGRGRREEEMTEVGWVESPRGKEENIGKGKIARVCLCAGGRGGEERQIQIARQKDRQTGELADSRQTFRNHNFATPASSRLALSPPITQLSCFCFP